MTESKSTGIPYACQPVRARERASARPFRVAGWCHPSPEAKNALEAPAGVRTPVCHPRREVLACLGGGCAP